jgi:hypothetical protein
MFYTRDYQCEPMHPAPEFEPRNILRVINYFPFINPRHVPKMMEAMEDKAWIELFCDMSAATITQLHNRKMIDLETVWRTVSQFFHQAIQLRGFETVPNPPEAFSRDRDFNSKIDILVAGTQAPAVYQSRVDRCIDVIRAIKPKIVHITFSGANPYGSMQRLGISGGVVTLNEAADMEIYFRQCLDAESLPEEVELTLARENSSDSTLSNIDHFFKGIELSDRGHRTQ